MHTAEHTANTVKALGDSARETGKVVEMIMGIASQTNLLASGGGIRTHDIVENHAVNRPQKEQF